MRICCGLSPQFWPAPVDISAPAELTAGIASAPHRFTTHIVVEIRKDSVALFAGYESSLITLHPGTFIAEPICQSHAVERNIENLLPALKGG